MKKQVSPCEWSNVHFSQGKAILLAAIILFIIPCIVTGQSLTNLPGSTINTRFYTDIFYQSNPSQGQYPVKHPGLSVNGFNNGGDNSHGYGPSKTWQV